MSGMPGPSSVDLQADVVVRQDERQRRPCRAYMTTFISASKATITRRRRWAASMPRSRRMTLISPETSPALSKFLPWISIALAQQFHGGQETPFKPLGVEDPADVEHDHPGHEDGDLLLPGEIDDLLVGTLAPAVDDGADAGDVGRPDGLDVGQPGDHQIAGTWRRPGSRSSRPRPRPAGCPRTGPPPRRGPRTWRESLISREFHGVLAAFLRAPIRIPVDRGRGDPAVAHGADHGRRPADDVAARPDVRAGRSGPSSGRSRCRPSC